MMLVRVQLPSPYGVLVKWHHSCLQNFCCGFKSYRYRLMVGTQEWYLHLSVKQASSDTAGSTPPSTTYASYGGMKNHSVKSDFLFRIAEPWALVNNFTNLILMFTP